MGWFGDGSERRLGRNVGCIYFRPCLDDGQNLGRGHVGQGDVVTGTEGQDITFALDRLRLEQEARQAPLGIWRSVVLLLFLDGAVIIYKDECVFVVGVGVARRPLVARAQVALGIVSGQINHPGALCLSSIYTR